MEEFTRKGLLKIFPKVREANILLKYLDDKFPDIPLVEDAIIISDQFLSYREEIIHTRGKDIPDDLISVAEEMKEVLQNLIIMKRVEEMMLKIEDQRPYCVYIYRLSGTENL